MAFHFNHRVQTDLFTLWGRMYIILMDEAIHWACCEFLPQKTAEVWHQVFLNVWVKYFGPPHFIVSDQEGSVISDLIGKACEAYDMDRDLQGSEGHTRTGMVERRLGIVKLAALKLYAQVQKQGLKKSQDDCIAEACMCSNSVLVYGSNTPNQALLGYEPRDLYHIDNKSVGATIDASSAVPDSIESSVRLRLHAKEAIIQAVIEHRIAEASNTKIQQYTPEIIEKLKVAGTSVDVW